MRDNLRGNMMDQIICQEDTMVGFIQALIFQEQPMAYYMQCTVG